MSTLLGIDIGGTAVKIGVVDENGKVLLSETRSVSFDGYKTSIMTTVANLAGEVLEKSPVKIEGIGVSATGQIDVNSGTVIGVGAQLGDWLGSPVKKILEDRFHLPVTVINDANAAALGEQTFGRAKGKENVLVVTVGTGIGGGIIENGRLIQGRRGIGGEIGHYIINFDGVECPCGNRGCFELYCGMNNIIVYAERLLTAENTNDVFFDMAIQQHRPLTPELIFEAREEGSLIIHELLCNTAEYLGAGIASLFNIYDFDRMIISGYLDNGKDDFLINRAIEYAKGWIINPYSRDLIVSRAHLNSNQLYLALSALVLKHLLDDTFHT